MENTEKEQIKENKTQRKLDGAESMVRSVIIIDSKGNPIPKNQMRIHSYDNIDETLQVVINDGADLITQQEWVLILNLIEKRVEYGGDVPSTKAYLDLYDKIEKIVCQNDCK